MVQGALDGVIPAALVPQVLLECYSVMTRPSGYRRAISPNDLLTEMRAWRSGIPVLDVKVEALDELERLVHSSRRAGGRVYDLFLIAQMRTHGIREICTVNVRDFRFPGIHAYLPEEALARYSR